MARIKKLLTLEDLAMFCEKKKIQSFSAANTGYKLAVQVPATFETVEDNSRDGLMKLRIKVCHIGKNRNMTYISKEAMERAMPSLKNRPVLGYIHQLDDGSYDFYGHNVEFIENEDGEIETEYLESPIGSFTEEDPVLEYDAENDKTYVVAYAVIYEEYSKAAEIIRKKQGTKNSCELEINAFAYNADQHCLELTDFIFSGSTMLGSDDAGNEILEGMEGSRADIVDFSEKSNGLFSHDKEDTPASDNNRKEDSGLLEKLLKKYGKTIEDLKFDYENMSDEDLKKKFEDEFDDDDDETEEIEEESEEVDDDDSEDDDDSDDDDETEETEEESDEEDDDEDDDDSEDDDDIEDYDSKIKNAKKVIKYEIRVSELFSILNDLCSQYRNDNEWCSVEDVYETYFIMRDWDNYKYYKMGYSIDDYTVSLVGEREEVFSDWVTASERDALKVLRTNYEKVCDKLDKYKSAELKAQKEEILSDEAYAEFINTENFQNLKNNIDDYSVDKLREKAELTFAKCVKESMKFSSKKKEKSQKSVRHDFQISTSKIEDKKPYGNLFDEK